MVIAGGVLLFASYLATGRQWQFLQTQDFWSGFVALCLITATGYWVNDVFDFKIDRINKPRKTIVNAHLSAKKVLTAYFVIVAGVLGVTAIVQPASLFLLNAAAIALLFAYAAWFKRFSVVGNLVIAALAGLVVYYAGLMFGFHLSMVWMTLFAFEITFIREVTKDVEDIRGDVQFRLHTLPIRIGIRATKVFLQVAYVVFILSCYVPFIEEGLRLGSWNLPYLAASVAGVQLPALGLMLMLVRSHRPADFARQSLWLKLLILPGLASLLLLH